MHSRPAAVHARLRQGRASHALTRGDGTMVVDPMRDEEHDVSIVLRYQGPAVEDGSMDVYDAAKNMTAFSDYVIVAAHKIYGEQIEVRAEVNAFQRGSFVTDLAFHVMGVAAVVLPLAPDLGGVINAIRESLDLYVFLRGDPAQKIEHRDDRSVHVTNNNGQIIQVNIESLSLALDEKAGKSAAQFVGAALSKPGVNQIEITSAGREVARVNDNEARFFRPIPEHETPIIEHVVPKMGLTIEEPSFKDGISNKWTMWDGEASLQYAMEDEDFIERIDSGELFGKGHILICDVRFTQTRAGRKLKIERAIVRVHDHRLGHEQAELHY